MDIFADLTWRGLVQDNSDLEVAKKLTSDDAFYVGFDPTATSLQVGNLVPLIVSAHLAKAGLKPIILFGGSTGAIGDPSGKNKERQLLTREELDTNIDTQKKQVTGIFSKLGLEPTFVNNLDWTRDITFLDFLRDVGKHFPVNYMVAKEVVKSRLEGSGISYAEFSYMLLQAYDFVHLYEHHNCKVQIGGSDQWGNITAGLELLRRKIQAEAFAFCFPLITDSSGKKFGKSEQGGAIWLDPEKTSPYKFHQFWLNIQDADAIRYLKMFSFLSSEEIAEVEKTFLSNPGERHAQKTLADTICKLVHGEDALAGAKKSAEVLFGGSLNGLTEENLREIFADVPSMEIPRDQLNEMTTIEFFVQSGIINSKGEAKRLIAGGGAYLNQVRVDDAQGAIKDLVSPASRLVVLRSGKKKYCLVKLTT